MLVVVCYEGLLIKYVGCDCVYLFVFVYLVQIFAFALFVQ